MSGKPPLGVMPIHIWKRQRAHELARAIYEYSQSENFEPHAEWVDELYLMKDHFCRQSPGDVVSHVPDPAPLRLEVGKTYLTRGGAAVTCEGKTETGNYECRIDRSSNGWPAGDCWVWRENGFFEGQEHDLADPLHIVSECTDPTRRSLPMPDGLPELPPLPEGKTGFVCRGKFPKSNYPFNFGERYVWYLQPNGKVWRTTGSFTDNLHHIEAV